MRRNSTCHVVSTLQRTGFGKVASNTWIPTEADWTSLSRPTHGPCPCSLPASNSDKVNCLHCPGYQWITVISSSDMFGHFLAGFSTRVHVSSALAESSPSSMKVSSRAHLGLSGKLASDQSMATMVIRVVYNVGSSSP